MGNQRILIFFSAFSLEAKQNLIGKKPRPKIKTQKPYESQKLRPVMRDKSVETLGSKI